VTTWILGDVHGCAEELECLLARLALGPGDRLLSVGDLFHRGPDPAGVLDLCEAAGAGFILGNHAHAVLARAGLAPARADGSDRPPRRAAFPPLEPADLAGDGRRILNAPRERLADFLLFLQGHRGYFLEHAGVAGAGPTRDGRPWRIVHANLPSKRPLQEARPEEFFSLRRSGLRRGFWYDHDLGPELTIYGHVPDHEVKRRVVGGALVALGLDTGCVYGGSLTAYAPELARFESVRARRAWAER
jgi:hypothetical protein